MVLNYKLFLAILTNITAAFPVEVYDYNKVQTYQCNEPDSDRLYMLFCRESQATHRPVSSEVGEILASLLGSCVNHRRRFFGYKLNGTTPCFVMQRLCTIHIYKVDVELNPYWPLQTRPYQLTCNSVRTAVMWETLARAAQMTNRRVLGKARTYLHAIMPTSRDLVDMTTFSARSMHELEISFYAVIAREKAGCIVTDGTSQHRYLELPRNRIPDALYDMPVFAAHYPKCSALAAYEACGRIIDVVSDPNQHINTMRAVVTRSLGMRYIKDLVMAGVMPPGVDLLHVGRLSNSLWHIFVRPSTDALAYPVDWYKWTSRCVDLQVLDMSRRDSVVLGSVKYEVTIQGPVCKLVRREWTRFLIDLLRISPPGYGRDWYPCAPHQCIEMLDLVRNVDTVAWQFDVDCRAMEVRCSDEVTVRMIPRRGIVLAYAQDVTEPDLVVSPNTRMPLIKLLTCMIAGASIALQSISERLTYQ